jgi:pimeloyl-ACP methyl ester carboxylesterase
VIRTNYRVDGRGTQWVTFVTGIAKKVRGARHVSVPKAAHIANIQNPEGFNRVLLDLLQQRS